jgi:hypothetical protein
MQRMLLAFGIVLAYIATTEGCGYGIKSYHFDYPRIGIQKDQKSVSVPMTFYACRAHETISASITLQLQNEPWNVQVTASVNQAADPGYVTMQFVFGEYYPAGNYTFQSGWAHGAYFNNWAAWCQSNPIYYYDRGACDPSRSPYVNMVRNRQEDRFPPVFTQWWSSEVNGTYYAGDKATIRFMLVDNLAGVDLSRFPGQMNFKSNNDSFTVSGTPSNVVKVGLAATFDFSFTIPFTAYTGTFSMTDITIADLAGNQLVFGLNNLKTNNDVINQHYPSYAPVNDVPHFHVQ